MAGHAHSLRTLCPHDTSNSTEAATKSVHAWVFDSRQALFVQPLCVVPSGLKEDCGTAIEGLELSWVDLRELKDGDTKADDQEAHDKGNDLLNRGLETLEEYDGGDDGEESDWKEN